MHVALCSQTLKNYEENLKKRPTNFNTANMLLRNLSVTGIDHHSRSINDILGFMIHLKVLELPQYFESRQFPLKNFDSSLFVNYSKRSAHKNALNSICDSSSLWACQENVEKNTWLLTERKEAQNFDLRFMILDFPYMLNLD
jgi:hypothetical protein